MIEVDDEVPGLDEPVVVVARWIGLRVERSVSIGVPVDDDSDVVFAPEFVLDRNGPAVDVAADPVPGRRANSAN